MAAKYRVTPVPAVPGAEWAILEDGSLVVVPHSVQGKEISHAVLSGGKPVRAAGEALIVGGRESGYWGTEINSRSGHFTKGQEQQWESIRRMGTDAFGKIGIYF